MSGPTAGRGSAEPPLFYEIRVGGVLDEGWSSWFAGLQIRSDDLDQTTICGLLADQAALHGVLMKIRDLGLPLISLRLIDEDS
jgi:hypothetical protein